MQIVTTREFRSNQSKFLNEARMGKDVILTSRIGSFRIVPISENDSIVNKEIRSSLEEVKAHIEGKTNLPLAKDLKF